MTLTDLARNGQVDALEERWLEIVESPDSVEEPTAALSILVAEGWTDRAAPLALLLAEPLLAAERHADALVVLRPVAGYAAEAETIRKQLLEALRGVHADDLWRETFLEVAGFLGETETPPDQALATFEHMCDHAPGRVVLNAAGWGLGVIEDRQVTGRLMVRFPDGALRPFDPHQFRERIKLLGTGDFRARKLTDPEALQRQLKEAPGEVVRSVVAARGGSATSLEIRDELLQGILTKSRWATFWKAAREALTQDPLVAVSGPPTRPRLTLRERPITLAEEADAALMTVASDAEAARIVSTYLDKGVDGEDADRLLDRLGERALPGSAGRGAVAAAGGLAVLLVLARNDRQSDPTPEEFLRMAVDTDERPRRALRRLFDATEDTAVRHEIVRLIPKAWPEERIERLLGIYTRLPREVQDTAVEVALECDGAAELTAMLDEMLRLPGRNAPHLLALTKAWAAGHLDGQEGAPDPDEILQATITVLAGLARGTGERLKLFKAWHQFTTSRRKSLLDRLLGALDEEASRAALSSTEMHRDLPDDVAAWIEGGVRERFPKLIQEKDIQFWDLPYIYATEAGVMRCKEEHRILVQEKLPANSKAIGRAAEMGDLSENAEWQAAIEERGVLSQRAEELQADLDKARQLELVKIPKHIVAPGCLVELLAPDGAVREVLLLGPWDKGDDRIVSYRSPFGSALLGAREGHEVTIELPDGAQTWRVTRVEIAVQGSG